ncbi:Rho termination factor [Sphingomonas olei]|uniref:Rho termination factor n=2 Tax=Sphingomonas olei TaxID=1886787 RepID=A0ABY2QIH7_9SPHN|nr:Rho termination factor N-terminal domain-containing protein [Sphingomonas olei]THG39609.1 Rho termination factor [Sphingomonas olei]
MVKNHGSQIKDDKLYEDLRRQGESKEKAARIANARANGSLDHRSNRLEDRSKEDLYAEAQKIGIEGRSKMNKSELVNAVRNHK